MKLLIGTSQNCTEVSSRLNRAVYQSSTSLSRRSQPQAKGVKKLTVDAAAVQSKSSQVADEDGKTYAQRSENG